VFAGVVHQLDIEHMHRLDDTSLLTVCLGGHVGVWNAATGEYVGQLPRAEWFQRECVASANAAANTSSIVLQSTTPTIHSLQIWSCCTRSRPLLALGCGDGRVEVWNVHTTSTLDAPYDMVTHHTPHTSTNAMGVTHVHLLNATQLVIGRLSGQIEFVHLRLVQSATHTARVRLVSNTVACVQAHERPITKLSTPAHDLSLIVLSASEDGRVRVWSVDDSRVCTGVRIWSVYNFL
jgi:WD40 repeat protein